MKWEEYKIEMLVNGIWVNAREPNGIYCYKSRYEKSAKDRLERLKSQWKQFSQYSRRIHSGKKIPTDFRIVSRMIDFNRYGVVK